MDVDAGSLVLAHQIVGLTNGVFYTFTVRATNAVGNGPSSAPSNSVQPLGIPRPPTSVAVVATGGANDEVSISFVTQWELGELSLPMWRPLARGVFL